MSHEVLYVVESSAKGPRCYVDRDAAVIDSEHYAPPAEVIEYVPRTTKPTAWQRLCHFLANGYDGHETRVRVEYYRPAYGRQHRVFLETNARNTDWGEGTTLDAALEKAMEKLP